MTALDAGAVAELFVTNVLNGTVAANRNVVNGGTVLRLLLVIVGNQPPKLVADHEDRLGLRGADRPGGAGRRPDRGRPRR